MNSFLNKSELKSLNFLCVGENVKISRKCSVYGAENIMIGNNVRIDDFCILSGKIEIGNNVHISAGTFLFGGETGIIIEDFSSVSSRCAIYSESDDYVGGFMANPTIPTKYRNVKCGIVKLCKHSLIGTGTTILPGVTINTGASVGAMSLVVKDLKEWSVNVGIPCKKIKDRDKNILLMEEKFANDIDIL